MQTPSIHTQKVTAASLLVALGIIYGDIGTSPLYVLKAIVGTKPITQALIYGGISCIFWTLTIQTTLKYILLTLQADNHGEGGIFSLYALVKRFGAKLPLVTMLGATTLLADGIITPPISVASAIEGLANIKGLEHTFAAGSTTTIGLVVGILSLLFFFQRFGTQRVGQAFGPIMVLWFGMLTILGLRQLYIHPSVLQAVNPYYAYQLLVQYPGGFWLLGAVFLATTGAEALYSDLGHCGRQNIRISWIFVKTALLINYIGQSAWLLSTAGQELAARNPFYEIMPSWWLIPGIIIATLATVIASQALISGSYTLISEAISLNFWPRVGIKQPTETKGQLYIPSVNLILWLGCILMILYFKSSEHMEAAYGFSITITMLMTTVLLTYFLYYIKKWPPMFVFSLLTLFICVESAFFIANVAKIKERWMFLFFEFGIFFGMFIWFNARKIINRLTTFVDLGKWTKAFEQIKTSPEPPEYAHLVYLTKANTHHQIEEKILKSILAKRPKKAKFYWLLHYDYSPAPYTLSYNVTELIKDTVFKININIGFRVQPKTSLYFNKILDDMLNNGKIQRLGYNQINTIFNEPDVTFVLLERYLSLANHLTVRDNFVLRSYFFLKNLAQKNEEAYGIDKSNLVTEQVPLVYNPIQITQLKNLNVT
jgi:KUP system potassium uptake protein